jgi:hypothetical protein
MISWLSDPSILLAGILLALIQFIAALPWLWVVDPKGFRETAASGTLMGYVGGGLLVVGIIIASLLGYKSDTQSLIFNGRYRMVQFFTFKF